MKPFEESPDMYVRPPVRLSVLLFIQGGPGPANQGDQPQGWRGRAYGCTDAQTNRFPLYSTGLRPLRFPPGPLPKKR